MKIMYMGTPDFAVAPLRALYEAGHEICAVVTQPDKPTGRGYKLTPPPVKVYAESCGLEVFQPETLKSGALLPLLEQKRPELIAVAAYGKILPSYLLDFPKYRCVNVHASLLPRNRGAAPINWCIINGEKKTGVTIMYMAKGIDTGDMLISESTPITDGDTAGTLHDRLAEMGARLLVEAVSLISAGKAAPQAQDESLQTYAPMLTKETCDIDFTLANMQVRNLVRGLAPFPGAFTTVDGRIIKIYSCDAVQGKGAPGEILAADVKAGIVIACGEGAVRLKEVKPEGKKLMSAEQYANGHAVAVGSIAARGEYPAQ